MRQHHRLVSLNPVLASALLAVGALQVGSAAGQDIKLEPGQSCLSAGCHEDIGQQKIVHMPAASGTTCIFCHEAPGPGEHSFELKATGGDLCTGCHNAAEFEGETVHGPVAEGNCINCHEPHASDHPKLVKATVPELCFDCHDRRLVDAYGKNLPATKNAFADEEMDKHAPFGFGQCPMCHAPHASQNHRLLIAPYPADFYTSYAKEKYFCFGCHDAGAFAEPRTLTATKFRNGNLNLHFRHVNREKGRTCRACHDHHGARNAKLIRDRVPFGERFINITNFELTETGGQCGPTCHGLVRYDRFDPEANRMKVSPRQGEDATHEALEQARKAQMN